MRRSHRDPSCVIAQDGTPYTMLGRPVSKVCILVTGIDRQMTEWETVKFFSAFGPIEAVNYRRDDLSHKPQGTMLVQYFHSQDAWQAFRMAQGIIFRGSMLYIGVKWSDREFNFRELKDRAHAHAGCQWVPEESGESDWEYWCNSWNWITARPWSSCSGRLFTAGNPKDEMCRIMFPRDKTEWTHRSRGQHE